MITSRWSPAAPRWQPAVLRWLSASKPAWLWALLLSPVAAQPALSPAAFGATPAATDAEAAPQQPDAPPLQVPEPAVDIAQQLLARQLPEAEAVWLSLPDPDRRTLLWRRSSYAASPRGQALIVAVDGWPARGSPHLQALQRALPEHRWDSAAINPLPPPVPPTEDPDPANTASPDSEEADADPVDGASGGVADSASPDASGQAAVDQIRRTAASLEAAYAALDAAAAILRQPGDTPPVLVGLEYGARLALDWIMAGGSASALVLIDIPGVPEAAELTSLRIPVLDLRTRTDPGAADRQGRRARRAQSLGDQYRTMALPPPVGAWPAGEPLLVRWLRGWMEQTADQPDTDPGAAASATRA